jgi:hypothetical protein
LLCELLRARSTSASHALLLIQHRPEIAEVTKA